MSDLNEYFHHSFIFFDVIIVADFVKFDVAQIPQNGQILPTFAKFIIYCKLSVGAFPKVTARFNPFASQILLNTRVENLEWTTATNASRKSDRFFDWYGAQFSSDMQTICREPGSPLHRLHAGLRWIGQVPGFL